MPQLDPAAWPPQLFWLAVTFLALYFIVAWLIVPRTGGAIEARKATVDADLAAAQAAKSGTDAAIAAYEKALAEARAKAQAMATENRNAINAEVDAERRKADALAAAKIAEAEKKVGATRDKALAAVKGVAAELAQTIVSELTGAKVTAAAAASAVDKAGK